MDLFQSLMPTKQIFAPDAYLLAGFMQNEADILHGLQQIIAAAPLRHMVTPRGFAMSVATTNCGALGWVSDKQGYRYASTDPLTGKAWPNMPSAFLTLATAAANEAGLANFVPDACLINQYLVGARMGLHQDKDEKDFNQPIVSVSLGLSAMFQFGGLARSDKPIKMALNHGDVVVFGGASRLCYHGILPLKPGVHALLDERRINMTFRKAG